VVTEDRLLGDEIAGSATEVGSPLPVFVGVGVRDLGTGAAHIGEGVPAAGGGKP
jgi:hypothetical protein